MALSFTANIGPISGVEFEFFNAGTVIYFANKALSWYSSREQAVSLEQTLQCCGTSLAAASTFNRKVYLALRRDYSCTYGVARGTSTTISRFRLPRASTAAEGDPGLLCLRAVTLGLLCFVDVDEVPAILKEILPSRLLHYEQESRDTTQIKGPLLAALIHYVKSIASEEGADRLRTRLLNDVDSQIRQITSLSLEELQGSEYPELGHMVGILDWLLTPALKRQSGLYRTRSLKVWCLAHVLSELGFEVNVDCKAITSPPDHTYSLEEGREDYSERARAVLVLAPGWLTDWAKKLSDTPQKILCRPVSAPPRLVSVREFPAVGYADTVTFSIAERRSTDARDLEEAFLGTFAVIRHQLSCNPKIREAARLTDPLPIDTQKYQDILTSSHDLEGIKDLFDRFQLHSLTSVNDFWVIPLLIPILRMYLLPWWQWRTSSPTKMNFMMDHLRLAFVLAALSLFIRCNDTINDDSGLNMYFVYTGRNWLYEDARDSLKESYYKCFQFLEYLTDERPLPSEISIWKRTWSKKSHHKSTSWSALVLTVLLNMEALPSEHDPSKAIEPSGPCWGAQATGLVILSDFLLRPSSHPSSAYVFHSLRGHLLDIPTNAGRIIEEISTVSRVPQTYDYLVTGDDIAAALRAQPPSYLDSLRIDLEPSWESNPSKCHFVLRAGGLPRLDMGLSSLFEACHPRSRFTKMRRVRCSESCHSCPGPESIIELMLGGTQGGSWSTLPLVNMLEKGQLGYRHPNEVPRSRDHRVRQWLVRTYDSDTLVMLALACDVYSVDSTSQSRKDNAGRIVSDCLGAALMAYICHSDIFSQSSDPVMIILSNEKHSRLLEESSLGYNRHEDLFSTAASILASETAGLDNFDGGFSSRTKEQVCNLISRAWECDEPIRKYIEIVQNRLLFHRAHGGITRDGIYDVLRALDIPSILLAKSDIVSNKDCVSETAEMLIVEWQKKNLTEAALTTMEASIEKAEMQTGRQSYPTYPTAHEVAAYNHLEGQIHDAVNRSMRFKAFPKPSIDVRLRASKWLDREDDDGCDELYW